MVGVINPANGTFIDRQQQAARKNVSFQLLPGQTWPAEGAVPTSSESPTTSAGNAQSSDHRIYAGAIAGIVVGAVALIGLAALIYFMARSRIEDVVDHTGVAPAVLPSHNSQPTSPIAQTPCIDASAGPTELVSPVSDPFSPYSMVERVTYELDAEKSMIAEAGSND